MIWTYTIVKYPGSEVEIYIFLAIDNKHSGSVTNIVNEWVVNRMDNPSRVQYSQQKFINLVMSLVLLRVTQHLGLFILLQEHNKVIYIYIYICIYKCVCVCHRFEIACILCGV